jgi:hypothetical protein
VDCKIALDDGSFVNLTALGFAGYRHCLDRLVRYHGYFRSLSTMDHFYVRHHPRPSPDLRVLAGLG